jgi:hypothetical protein
MSQSYEKSWVLFFYFRGVGWDLSPLGTSATNWPTVPGPDDRRAWSSWWNENWQGTPKYSEKTCPNATLSTINPIWSDLGSNPGRRRRGGMLVTNRVGYGTVSQKKMEQIGFYSFLVRHTSQYYQNNLIHSAQCHQVTVIVCTRLYMFRFFRKPSSEGPSTF